MDVADLRQDFSQVALKRDILSSRWIELLEFGGRGLVFLQRVIEVCLLDVDVAESDSRIVDGANRLRGVIRPASPRFRQTQRRLKALDRPLRVAEIGVAQPALDVADFQVSMDQVAEQRLFIGRRLGQLVQI